LFLTQLLTIIRQPTLRDAARPPLKSSPAESAKAPKDLTGKIISLLTGVTAAAAVLVTLAVNMIKKELVLRKHTDASEHEKYIGEQC